MNAISTLQRYFDSGYPVIAVETLEEKRLLQECKKNRLADKIFSIAAAGGLFNESGSTPVPVPNSETYPKAFEYIAKMDETVLMVYDFQHMVSAAVSYRPLIRIMDVCKARGTTVCLVGPLWKLPEELKHLVPIVRSNLPGTDELETALNAVLKATQKTVPGPHRITLLSAARGLILEQAENAFALSAKDGFDYRIVENEKMNLVRSDYMSVENPKEESLLAGLGQLKAYIREEVLPSKDDIQLQVRGLCLIGVPGTGKSLSARVIASLLRWPLVRFDIAAAKGSLVGQSEANMRKALQTADAISPCVLWLDEIEKAVGGHSSSAATDGGTTLAMVGTLLTWMQEHRTQVLVVATCNDHLKLPSEMLRARRFDEKFFLDLPSYKEREEVATIHLTRLKCDVMFAEMIADMTNEWTPAEIEQLIISGARRTARTLSTEVLTRCSNEIIPISKSGSIQELRDWASKNLRRANTFEEVKTGRKMRGSVQ